jgi:hypothetical protein
MKLPYLNIIYFLYYQKFSVLYNDLQIKKPKKLPVLSYLHPDMYNKWKVPVNVYNNIIVNTHSHTRINTEINKYITNKLL